MTQLANTVGANFQAAGKSPRFKEDTEFDHAYDSLTRRPKSSDAPPATGSSPLSPVDSLLNPGESASQITRMHKAAGRVFIKHGYNGASMEKIAKVAAVTRQTHENRYPDGLGGLVHGRCHAALADAPRHGYRCQ